jgi:plastocyanin
MKKISLLLAVALATFILTACSASSKSTPPSASNRTHPWGAARTVPALSPTAQPSANPTAPSVSNPASTTPPAVDPAATDPRNPDMMRGPGRPHATPQTTSNLVTIQNFEFSPASLTIKTGETVKWTNKDGMPHTVTSDTFKSDMLRPNNFFTHIFDKAGTFNYSCSIHPSMKGTIIVK